MYDALIAHMQKFVSLTDEEQQLIPDFFSDRKLKKKEHLLTEGQRNTAQYFVTRGCLRLYYIKDSGAEHIVQFGIDNWWIADYMTLGNDKPANFYIQAVEASNVLVLTEHKQEALLTELPKLEKYFRKVMQKAYAASQMRVRYIFDYSGEEQYTRFSESFPDFVQRVPQYMLASYLGFTPEFLSKIRAKKELK